VTTTDQRTWADAVDGPEPTAVEIAVFDAAMAEELTEELGLSDDPVMRTWLEQRRKRSSERWPYP
jgi:hypothetical protein